MCYIVLYFISYVDVDVATVQVRDATFNINVSSPGDLSNPNSAAYMEASSYVTNTVSSDLLAIYQYV